MFVCFMNECGHRGVTLLLWKYRDRSRVKSKALDSQSSPLKSRPHFPINIYAHTCLHVYKYFKQSSLKYAKTYLWDFSYIPPVIPNGNIAKPKIFMFIPMSTHFSLSSSRYFNQNGKNCWNQYGKMYIRS